MTAFSASERASLFDHFGWPPGTNDLDPALANAVARVEALSDGDATKSRVQGHLTALAAVDAAIQNAALNTEADTVNKLRVDPARGMLAMQLRGRQLVSHLEGIFGVLRKCDVYSPFT